MEISATQFRQNIYKLLEKVHQTGESITIKSKGHVFKLSASEKSKKKSKFDNLKKRKVMVDDPEEYVHIDWSKEWNPGDI